MRPPSCSMVTGEEPCESPQDHEGYRHAATWEEAIEAERAGATIYDRDGDKASNIIQGDDGFLDGQGQYAYGIPGDMRVNHVDVVNELLVPDDLVSENELAETIRSLQATLDARPNQGPRRP